MGFSVSRVPSPVWGLDNCDLDIDSYRDGNRKQLRLWRISTDINLKILMSRRGLLFVRRFQDFEALIQRRECCLRMNDKTYAQLSFNF